MSGKTSIEWTERTWNPVTGCTKVSLGCDHCYAEAFAERWRGTPGHPYEQGFDLKLWPERLDLPLRWKKPSMIFTNSMSDMLHTGVPDGFIMDVWRVMGEASHHTFQVLTKRADRMERWLGKWADTASDADVVKANGMPPMPRGPEAVRAVYSSGRSRLFAAMIERWGPPPEGAAYPLYDWIEGMRWWPRELFNVWLGVSVESPSYYSRIRHLQRTPARVRFLSCEPLLAPLPDLPLDGIHWVIVGGESGPGARPAELDWFREIRDQCVAAGVPFFLKQLGKVLAGGRGKGGHGEALLDGERWTQMPT